MKKNVGFTLIEMMVVITLIAILASIAYPSYRRYTVRNAESETQATMKQLEIQLNRWRATTLTYKGFKPLKIANDGTKSYAYDAADNMTIYVPANSDASTYKYKITLASVTRTTIPPTSQSLVTSSSSNINSSTLAVGRNWAMFATPNPDTFIDASNILLNSNGTQCKAKSSDSTVTILSTDCGSNGVKW